MSTLIDLSPAFMRGVDVLHLRLIYRVLEPVSMSAPGSSLRGALLSAFDEAFHFDDPEHPVNQFLTSERKGESGTLPRQFTTEQCHKQYLDGDQLVFGVTLIGTQALELLPYFLLAARKLGEIGLGQSRSKLRLLDIDEFNPLTQRSMTLVTNQQINAPKHMITVDHVLMHQPQRQAKIVLMSPLQLLDQNKPVTDIHLSAVTFFQRLHQRMRHVAEACVSDVGDTRQQYAMLSTLAQTLHWTPHLRWVEQTGYSNRAKQSMNLSGLFGTIDVSGDNLPLLYPYLLWAQSLHVGRNAPKGCGQIYIG